MKFTRRSLLQAMGTTAAGAAVGCKPNPDPVVSAVERIDPTDAWEGRGTPDEEVFPLGVASGDPTSESVLLWTRTTSSSEITVEVAAWREEAWESVGSFPVEVVDGFVHHVVTELDADLPLAFQFKTAEDEFSRVGYSRTTLAADGRGVIRIGATSCASFQNAPFPSMTQVAARGPLDVMLWVGDQVYADGSNTVEDYREKWEAALDTEGFRSLLTACASLCTWDDHEVNNNWDPTILPEELVANARQVFFEMSPLGNPEGTGQIWRSVRYGKTVEIFVLECRGERNPDTGMYISSEQFQWLVDGVTQSEAVWKLIVNSVPISNMPEAYDFADLDLDRWEGYPVQRQALLDAISGVSGTFFVSGDFHHCTLAKVEPSGPSAKLLEFLVGPAGSNLNPLGGLLQDDVQFLWSSAAWCSSRIDLSDDGTGKIEWIFDSGETFCSASFNVDGEVYDLEYVAPDGTEPV